MTILGYKTTNTNTGFVLASIFTLITAISLLVFGIDIVLGIFVFVSLSILFYRRPMFLLLLWPVLACLEVFFSDYVFRLQGYVLFPMDVAYLFSGVYLIINTVVRPRDVARVLKENRLLSLFLLMVGVYIAFYTPVYGKSAIGEARKFYFFFLFPLLAELSIKEPRDLRRLMLFVYFGAAGISLSGLLRLPMGEGYRTVNAEGSLILMLTVLSIVVFRMNSTFVMNRSIDAMMLAMCSAVVIITGHRSVWLAGGLGLFVLFVLHRERIVFFGKVVVATLLVLGVLGVAVMSTSEFGQTLMRKASGIIDPYSDSNASWRMKGWEQQLDRIWETNPLLGEGLGGYYSWVHKGTEVKVSPHNAYVQLVLKFGLLGLIMYGLIVLRFFRDTLHVRKKVPRGPRRAYLEAGILNFGAAHAYMIAYGINFIVLIFFAVGMSALRFHRESWGDPRTG